MCSSDLFAAGMSGGVVYVLDRNGRFPSLVNYEMVELEPIEASDVEWLRGTIERHHELTGSVVAKKLLAEWSASQERFVKVMPKDYKRVMNVMREAEVKQLSEAETLSLVMAASHG